MYMLVENFDKPRDARDFRSITPIRFFQKVFKRLIFADLMTNKTVIKTFRWHVQCDDSIPTEG